MKKESSNKAIISLTDYLILNFLSDKNNSNNKQISEGINVSQTKVCYRLKHLEQVRLIKREKAKKGNLIVNSLSKNKNIIKNFLNILKVNLS